MLRITAEVFPGGGKEGRRKVFQMDVANMGQDATGLTEYLYLLQEVDNLNKKSTDVSGKVKFQRQAGVLSFLKKFTSSVDTGRELTEDEIKLIEKMREL